MTKIFLIINVKTLIVGLLSVVSTYLCIRYGVVADFPLTLIATAIVFPVVFSINGAYKRREQALTKYSDLKAYGKALYFATRDWLDNSPEPSRAEIKRLLEGLLVEIKHLFSNKVDQVRQNEEAVYRRFSALSKFIQSDLRGNGLASGEVSRCNQYLSKMFVSFEDAKHIYQYRTPRTLKTFSDVFISLLPILYGPYFAFQALEYSPYVTYVMPALFSLVLVSLSNIQDHLENPFDGIGEDDIAINVQEFVRRLYD
ncbi:hypothetical protein R50072_27750 [Simiduia litorea]|uniref:hypothetical protein n=1 Tax=Simiduia litorea TaxID=1435348 RepID=UPI0036F20BBD